MKLRILDLGNINGLDYFSYADYPMVNDIGEDIWLIIGKISNNHFSIGRNKNIDDYLKEDVDREDFTFTRSLEDGGLMWLKDVMIIKVVYPNINDFSSHMTDIITSIMYILKFELNKDVRLSDSYVLLDGNKVSGYASSFINEKSSAHLSINISDIPPNIKYLYKNKKFDNVTSIGDTLPYNDLRDKCVEWMKKRLDCDIEYISKDDLDIKDLLDINNSEDWISRGIRQDIKW